MALHNQLRCRQNYGLASLTLNAGSGGAGGAEYGLPWHRRQMVHFCIILLTKFLPFTIQYLERNSVRVAFTPLCITISWQSLTMRSVTWCSLSRSTWCLVYWGKSEFPSRPPHLHRSDLSWKRPNCTFHCLKFLISGRFSCDVFSQYLLVISMSPAVSTGCP